MPKSSTTEVAPSGGEARPKRHTRQSVASEIQSLKARDNTTNLAYLARVWLIIGVTAAMTVSAFSAIAATGWSAWWMLPVGVLAVVVMGASQHQLGGAIHEGAHFMLFADQRLNEVLSDWCAAFPIYSSTYHYRVQHLAHHQFVNDAERDPDLSQLQESGHDLEFPLTHIEFLWALIRQLWLPNLVRYTIARAKYGALGNNKSPYADPALSGSKWPNHIGVLFAAVTPFLLIAAGSTGDWRLVAFALVAAWSAAVAYYAVIPLEWFPRTRLEPVISHRATAIGRMTFMALVYGALAAAEQMGAGPAWSYYGLLWVLPLFTTFPFVMILRQWVQHGNADRGRFTNTRVFLVGPLVRYAVFPWGMDYHLPHHMFASVPHYKLKALHEVLLRDPEYREKAVVVQGYFGPDHPDTRRPTAVSVLARVHALAAPPEPAFVDETVLERAEVSDRAGIGQAVALSRRGAVSDPRETGTDAHAGGSFQG